MLKGEQEKQKSKLVFIWVYTANHFINACKIGLDVLVIRHQGHPALQTNENKS